MASISGSDGRTIINPDDPGYKKPPVLASGPLAWLKDNLFASVTDTILTVISAAILVSLIVTFFNWSISQANWYVISRNLELFMLGPLQADPGGVLRVQILSVIVVTLTGLSIAAWSRLGRSVFIGLGLLVAALLLIPPVISATTPLPNTYLSAGSSEIVAGTQAETPGEQIGFIAREGETVSVNLATAYSTSDTDLRAFAGFTDSPARNVVNASQNREEAIEEAAQIEAALEDPDLTDNERSDLEADLVDLQEIIAVPVIELYDVNTEAVTVTLLNGAGEVLNSTVLEPGSPPLEVEIDTDGWYILQKRVQGDSIALLETTGIYPHNDRQVIREVLDENGEPALTLAGTPRTETIDQYVRFTDAYVTELSPPETDGETVPLLAIAQNQYQGVRPVSDYSAMFFGPFLGQLARGLVPLIGIFIMGYIIAQGIDRLANSEDPRKRPTMRIVRWIWPAMPIIIFLIVAPTDVTRWGGLFLTFMLTAVGIVASFPIGVLLALGRRTEGLPVVQKACVLYIEFIRGVPLITLLFLFSLALPLVSPQLSTVPGVVRAMVAITLFSAAYLAENVRGGLQSVPPGQVEAAKALGLSTPQVTLFITLPQALRAVIPALVGQFISLFKDTSLVAIVGLTDLTNIALTVVARAEFADLRRETFMFISIIYFIFSYAMSYVSRRIEASGSGALRTQEAA